MRPKVRGQVACLTLCGMLLVPMVFLVAEARADDPMLAIRFTGGESAIYSVRDIERIGFEGGETLIVVSGSGSESYATGTIGKIELLWGFSSVADPAEAAALLDVLHLLQNQPNPFSPETRIGFELPQAGEVKLEIYSADGRLVRTLVAGERAAGRQEVRWDRLDDAGREMSGGVYFYSLRAPGIEESRRMILLP